MIIKYILQTINHYSTALTSWSWQKLYSDRKKGYGLKIMERDRHRQLNEHAKEVNKHKKEMQLSRSLKKEVVAGANGTQDYIIKEGPNKGKIADKGQ